MRRFLFAGVLFLALACHSKPKAYQSDAPPLAEMIEPPRPTSLEEALTSPYRSKENLSRDTYRHPLETLKLFGIKPDMTVIEANPGTGWYLEILAPFLSTQGQYVQASGPNVPAKVTAFFNQHPEIANRAQSLTFDPPAHASLGQAGSADMVLTFRNLHNFMQKGIAEAFFHAAFKVLKPGGTLGIVDHRADSASKPESGYVSEHDVIHMAKAAGFRLGAKSEINANPKDTKDYPGGVWTLPPSLRLGDQDRQKYLAIGESDRMTLRFTKVSAGH